MSVMLRRTAREYRCLPGLSRDADRILSRATDCQRQPREHRANDYNFISERALDACSTYGVESISLTAVRPARPR